MTPVGTAPADTCSNAVRASSSSGGTAAAIQAHDLLRGRRVLDEDAEDGDDEQQPRQQRDQRRVRETPSHEPPPAPS